MSKEFELLFNNGMKTAGVFYKNKNQPILRRLSAVSRYYLDTMELPKYQNNQRLFLKDYFYFGSEVIKDDLSNNGLKINISGEVWFNSDQFYKFVETQKEEDKSILYRVASDMHGLTGKTFMGRYEAYGLHVMFNYKRILEEGIIGYKNRVNDALKKATQFGQIQFYNAMLDVADGMIHFIERYVGYLEDIRVKMDNKIAIDALIQALKNAPKNPAKNYYEALISIQVIMFFSQQLEIGSIDRYLLSYFENDIKNNQLSINEATDLLDEFFAFIDNYLSSPYAVHLTIGGTLENGNAHYNEITKIVLNLCKKHRQPNVTLKVRKDMPQDIWDMVLDNIKNGSAQPALVNDDLFISSFTKLNQVPFEDAVHYTFSGCSEAQIEGKTNVDSTYVSFNLLDVLEVSIHNLTNCDSYELFYDAFMNELKFCLNEMKDHVNIRQHHDKLYRPYPIATFFMDDCIQSALTFSEGGARYNFDNTNLYGNSNVINSLYTIKKIYNRELGNYTVNDLLIALKQNYTNSPDLYMKIKKLKKFGNYCPELDLIAKEFTTAVFNEINSYRTYRGNGYFTPSIIGWVDFGPLGKLVGPTPDGRKAGETLADSIGPSQGTDVEGPTSMINSITSIPQHLANGTCILNMRIDERAFDNIDSVDKIKFLIRTYFDKGGSQLQINVVNNKILLKALENPEEYKNIIVRIGGFSDYFVKQTREIKEDIIRRSNHLS